ncbi:MAG: hypothetical protein M1832_002606 [Thelocarpon impressellum]|nr:MAG: hypothetical protein M1832_002606 [Thelocarpon impressellum]
MAAAQSSSLTPQSLKRPSEGDVEPGQGRAPKRQRSRRQATHHHRIQHKQEGIPSEATSLPDESVQAMLTRSLTLMLKEAGFDGAALTAVESLRADVDEYMTHFTASITQSMHSSRRTHPTPQDFDHALHREGLNYSDLTPHLKPSVSPSVALPPLPLPSREEPERPSLSALEPSLSGTFDRTFVPPHLPRLPGKHTYKSTAEFSEREKDPRRLRERATEEGRLGEEALRRLLAAGSSWTRGFAGKGNAPQNARQKRTEEMWEQTLQAMTETAGGGVLEIDLDDKKRGWADAGPGGLVNAERAFWRKGMGGGGGNFRPTKTNGPS